jgi:outer membrane protein OmpA-like peptidoglycan-associated protein
VGVPKKQLYTILGVPHFGEGVGGNRYWDYLINIKDPANPTAPAIACQLKVQWDTAQRTNAVIERLYWKNPVVCPPLPEPIIVVREVIKEVPKEVVREVVREVRVPATSTVSNVSNTVPINTYSMQLDALFTHNGSSLDEMLPESKQRLEAMITRLKAGGQLESVMVTGHADRTGIEAGNQRLAQARADTVAAYLMRMVGQPMKGATVGARSSRDALVSCAALQGKALEGCLQPNRRVVIEATTVKR